MPEPIIDIQNLHTRYGKRDVLKGVNLEIFPHETFVILGRSGCGKSTLLRHLVGLDKPSAGEIYIKGKDWINGDAALIHHTKKKIGMLFQNGALFNSMTIGDNVALPLREHTSLEESTIQIMMRMKLELVGLAEFENYYPSQLSGGMKKRAALARALAMDPELLFCDEPSAGLDPIVAVGIDHLILKLKKAFNMTIIVVTHELASVFEIADRIALLEQGKVLFVGTLEEMQNSDLAQVKQFLERQPDDESMNRDHYVRSLIEP
ncbi:ATP-binding cassette domain-containing protein [candidate division KSB1 bacterium]|nr:ATP-binding cassette domain-containing protein [candidate division KSB1 bacterium]